MSPPTYTRLAHAARTVSYPALAVAIGLVPITCAVLIVLTLTGASHASSGVTITVYIAMSTAFVAFLAWMGLTALAGYFLDHRYTNAR